jgi:putative glutamine amidotransferase
MPFRHAGKLKAYEDAVRAGGMEPAPVSVSKPMSLNGFAGLVLLGGTDVNPQRYREASLAETEQPDDERDGVELKLIEEAIQKDVPILAICRGLQILNVYHGGTLIQHLPSAARHDPELDDNAAAVHEVTIEPDSLLQEIAGETRMQVNSRHHQAAGRIGAGLRISARDAEDGTVEGLERPDRRFVVAVQWHPEDQMVRSPEQLKLFRRFAEVL